MIRPKYHGKYTIKYYGHDIGMSIQKMDGKSEPEHFELDVIITAMLDGGFAKDLVEKIMDYVHNFHIVIINYDDFSYSEVR